MSRLPLVSYRELARVLDAAGFTVARQRGSHVSFRHPDGRATTVPRHDRQIGRPLLRAILSEAEISLDEFEKLRRSG